MRRSAITCCVQALHDVRMVVRIIDTRIRTARVLLRVTVVLMLLVAIFGTGCSSSRNTTTPDSNSGPVEATQSDQGGAPSPPTPAAPSSGLVVETFDLPNTVTIGLIDASSGVYSEYASFPIGPSQVVSNQDRNWNVDFALSRDLARYATYATEDGVVHAGWVDASGNFTDVNAGAGPPDAFGGAAPHFSPVGFDKQGNFFYEAGTSGPGNAGTFYKLQKGSTSNPEVVGQRNTAGPQKLGLDGNGEMVVYTYECFQRVAWLNPAEYLHVVGDAQIYRTAVADAPGIGGCDSPTGRPLLPETNTSFVSNPVASPDGTRVAFLLGGDSLYIVDADGSTRPSPVNVSGVNLGNAHIVAWK